MEEQNLEKKLKGSIWEGMKSALWIGTTALALFSLIACQPPQDTTPKEPVYQEQKEEKRHQKEDKFIRRNLIEYAVFHIPEDVPDYLSAAIVEHADFRLTEKEEKMVSRYDNLIKYFCNIDYLNNNKGIDPGFVKAMIAIESRGNPKACSKKYHARGLSQIRYWRAMPYLKEILESNINLEKIAKDIDQLGFNAKYINKEILGDLKAKYLHDPPLSILLLCFGVSKNLEMFGNRLDLVSAEWNVGLTLLHEHKGFSNKGKHPKKWNVPQIKETTEYIGRINKLYDLYSCRKI